MHYQGASELGKAMLEVYGEDSFALIIDEGGQFPPPVRKTQDSTYEQEAL